MTVVDRFRPLAEALPGGGTVGSIRPMTALPMSHLPVMIKVPTRGELRDMLLRPSIAITAIVCATIAFLGAIAGIVYLVANGKDSAVIGVFVAGPVVLVLGVIAKRLGAVKEAVSNATVITPPVDGKA